MGKYKVYEEYKDSGVEWLGKVPVQWSIKKLKFICNVKTGTKDTVNAVDDGLYPFFVRSQTIERINTIGADCEAVLTAGDGAGVGKVFHYYNGKFDYHQRVYMLNGFSMVLGKFVFYYLSSNFYKVALEGNAKSTVDSLRLPQFLNFEFSLPSINVQNSIVQFFDHETAKIDKLIEKQHKLIELLKEKRQAVISHAVTKGLNPDVPMKDSGVEWLGEVPEHWKIKKGKYLFEELNRPVRDIDGIVTVFRDGQVCLRTRRRESGFTMAILEHGYQGIRKGDLVIHSMDAFAGAIGVSEDDGRSTPEYVVVNPLRNSLVPEYYAKILKLMAQRDYIFILCPSVRERAPRFRFSKFQTVLLPVPPGAEQIEIHHHMNKMSRKLDDLIEKSEKQINLLQERRTALISAAVTGKIDVRDWQSPKQTTYTTEEATV